MGPKFNIGAGTAAEVGGSVPASRMDMLKGKWGLAKKVGSGGLHAAGGLATLLFLKDMLSPGGSEEMAMEGMEAGTDPQDIEALLGQRFAQEAPSVGGYEAGLARAESRGRRAGEEFQAVGSQRAWTDPSLDELLSGHQGRLAALQGTVPPTITQLYAQNGLLSGFLGGRAV